MRKGFKHNVKGYTITFIALVICQWIVAQQPRTVPANYSNDVNISFVRTWIAKAPESDPNLLMTRPLKDVMQSTQYSDGLGRPLQTVIKQGSLLTGSTATDLVSPIEYDQFDREQYKYLSYAEPSVNNGTFKLNPFSQQAAFYNSLNSASPLYNQNETFFYSKTNFDGSPLNQVTDIYSQGNSWVGSESNVSSATRRNIQVKHTSNTDMDAVHIFTVTDNAFGTFGTYTYATTGTTKYAAGQLDKTIIIDESKKQTIEFKDRNGNVILKKVQVSTSTGIEDDGTGREYTGWLSTYYVYDDIGSLRCVIQPEGVKSLVLSGWSGNGQLSTNILDEQCFRYEYDQRNRMIMKKAPGAGEVHMVYDNRDRLVMSQDANMRQGTVKWMIIKYDALNRPTETGLWTNNTSFTTHLSSAYYSSDYPGTISNYEQLTLNHFDDYIGLPGSLSASYLGNWNENFATTDNNNWPYPQIPIQSNAIKGLLTWTETKVLGTSNTYLYSLTIYDERARPIQIQSTNITGGIDVTTTQYNWTGQQLVVVQKQDKQGSNPQISVVAIKMTYDDLTRPIKIERKLSNSLVNGNSMSAYKTIVQNEYDKVGQLKKKTLGSNSLEILTYDYNIRSWLLGMNRGYLSTTGQNGNTKFGFELGYDKLIGSSGRNFLEAKYNGNISGMIWKSDGDDVKRKYDFNYDPTSRLLKGDFEQDDGTASWNKTTMDYSILMGNGTDPTSAYDDNGNIKGMTQFGWKLGVLTSTPIDNLHYTYITGTNRLKSVTDFNNDADSKLGDFKTKATHPQAATKSGLTSGSSQAQFDAILDYNYDANGNLSSDNNKAISSIAYNHLNLPSAITVIGKGDITYTYDATGNKLRKVSTETGASVMVNGISYSTDITTTTTYIGDFVYESKSYSNETVNTVLAENEVLQFINHEEGRIRFKPIMESTAARFEYDYMIKDHLGNVRMVLTEEQRQDVYPAATLEPNLVGVENAYYTVDQSKIVSNSTANNLKDASQNPQTYPNNNGISNNNTSCTGTLCTTDISQYLYQLNSNNNKTGLGITLKVMAGDKIDIFGKSYYYQNNPGSSYNNTIPIIDLLSGFLNGPLGGTATSTHGIVAPTQINTTSGIAGINSMMNSQSSQNNINPLRPRAFINCIIFDEQFKAIDFKISMVGANSQLYDHHSDLQNITIPKNGFVYIYCSNESPINVFFDNLQVVHTRGPILEETHYYPFGLTMSGISSKALDGSPENRKKFIGQQFDDELGLNWYQFRFRNHDPQIGRFIEIDPLADKYVYNSTYAYAENKVGKGFDLEGLETHEFNIMLNATGFNVEQENKKAQARAEHFYKAAEPYVRVTKDVITIAGGVTLLIASGGTASPLLVGLMGSATVSGGVMKLTFDVAGNKEAAEKIPTTLSGTLVFFANNTSEDLNGKKLISDDVKTVAEFTEGVLTFEVKGFDKMSDVKKLSTVLSGLSLTLDAVNPETKKAFTNLLSGVGSLNIPALKIDNKPKVDNTYNARPQVLSPLKTETKKQ